MSPRLVATLSVVVFLCVTHAVAPDGEARSRLQYALVITLGYGHLLGAALPALRRGAGRGALLYTAQAVSVATAFGFYAAGARAWPALPLVPVALSVWHIVENDLALARARRGGGSLAPLARGREQLPALAGSALVLGLAFLALPEPGRFGDVWSAVTLHHLVAWIAHRLERGDRLVRLAGLHAAPALVCAALWMAPDLGLRAHVSSPGLYLFWSTLHVLQTARARWTA
jgi:hypothetical protein